MHKRHDADKPLQKRIVQLIEMQYDKLTRYESVDGGWGYYDFRYEARKPTSSSISFVNGTVLIAFAEAKAIGVAPPERIVKRAIAALLRQQKPDFSYLYGEYLQYQPMRGINRPGGSLQIAVLQLRAAVLGRQGNHRQCSQELAVSPVRAQRLA